MLNSHGLQSRVNGVKHCGIFPFRGAMCNHSDRPNMCVQSADPGPVTNSISSAQRQISLKLRTIRDITPGEELTICCECPYFKIAYFQLHTGSVDAHIYTCSYSQNN